MAYQTGPGIGSEQIGRGIIEQAVELRVSARFEDCCRFDQVLADRKLEAGFELRSQAQRIVVAKFANTDERQPLVPRLQHLR